ncbi:MAG: insulinase family protein [Rikenellaceae bacterium]|nr:insulinase family protein [Rikenellaceae bacterium]
MIQPPAITIPQTIRVAQPTEQRLANGVRLLALTNPGQNVVRLSFVFEAGTTTQHKPFVASSAQNLLSEGSSRHSAIEIAEALDYYGSYFEVSLDRDYSVITFCCLTRFFEESIGTFEEILLDPLYAPDEISIYASKRKQSLEIERRKTATKARERFAHALFGDGHPYGVSYHENLYDDLTHNDLKEFYRRRYTAENCFVVCSLDDDPKRLARIARFAEQIPSTGCYSPVEIPAPTPSLYDFEQVDQAVQSSIRVGKLLFGRQHPDFVGMQVVTYILGGYFGSRLIENLRERNGFTYSVFASMINMRHAGYMAIATDVGCEFSERAVEEIRAEVGRLSKELVSAEELETVRRIMFGEFMRILDGPMGLVDVTIEATQNGTDNHYIARSLDEIRTITPTRIRDLAERYLNPETLTTIIVGNLK